MDRMGHPRLARRLGTADAVVLGLGAMLGTGVFTVMAPAAAAAGSWLLLGLLVAAIVATCNAVSSADLAAAHPESGGTYVYGRERLGHAWGFLAGTAFLAGKTASCAAAALVFAEYVAPSAGRPVALAAVAAMTGLNVAGVRWTVRGTRILVGIVLAVLAVAVGVIGADAAVDGRVTGPSAAGSSVGPWDVLQAAGLLFFAFAGYARIATLGEEVRDPARSIRRAIPLALAIVVVVYAAVAVACLVALGAGALSRSSAPISDAVEAVGADRLVPLVAGGAAVATLSALLSVLVGVSRTSLAMARRADLPPALAMIGRAGTPWRADLAAAGVVAVLVLVASPVSAVGLSAFCVLLYYAVTNASALRLRRAERHWPRWTAYLGLAGCLVLAATLPPTAVLAGTGLIAAGTAARALARRRAG
jgi:basic amino acid/polyamine antiporter, APA family